MQALLFMFTFAGLLKQRLLRGEAQGSFCAFLQIAFLAAAGGSRQEGKRAGGRPAYLIYISN